MILLRQITYRQNRHCPQPISRAQKCYKFHYLSQNRISETVCKPRNHFVKINHTFSKNPLLNLPKNFKRHQTDDQTHNNFSKNQQKYPDTFPHQFILVYFSLLFFPPLWCIRSTMPPKFPPPPVPAPKLLLLHLKLEAK